MYELNLNNISACDRGSTTLTASTTEECIASPGYPSASTLSQCNWKIKVSNKYIQKALISYAIRNDLKQIR